MKNIKYIEHIRVCRMFGFKPRNPISFLFWKIFSKKGGEQ